jgi:hypothetical protein
VRLFSFGSARSILIAQFHRNDSIQDSQDSRMRDRYRQFFTPVIRWFQEEFACDLQPRMLTSLSLSLSLIRTVTVTDAPFF